MEQCRVAIVVVTWNNEQDIADCLKSLFNQTEKQLKIIVVDNLSSDQTCEIVSTQFPEVTLLTPKTNLYLAGGNNLGIRHALQNFKPQYLMVINPDTKAEPTMLTEMLKVIDQNKKIGAVGPKVKFWGGKRHGLLYSCGIYFDGFNWAAQIGHLEKDQEQFNQTQEVFGIEGTCILIRTEMFQQLGGFWEKLKMYLEDVEFFIRAKKFDWKAVYCPKAVLWHKVMQSTKQNKNLKLEQQKMRNWLLIAFRNYPLISKLAMLKKYLWFKIGL